MGGNWQTVLSIHEFDFGYIEAFKILGPIPSQPVAFFSFKTVI